MKTSTTVVIGALALAATLGAARVASAGKKTVHEVTVDLGARKAWGAMGDARRSADSTQLITVTIRGMANFLSGQVVFKDANNVSGSCFTTEPKIVAALQSVKSDSHVSIEWDAQGQCVMVDNYTSSTRSVKEQ